jgi:hypothetical protein
MRGSSSICIIVLSDLLFACSIAIRIMLLFLIFFYVVIAIIDSVLFFSFFLNE